MCSAVAASPAAAATYLFNLSGSQSASFQLQSSPSPVGSFSGDDDVFWLDNVAGSYASGATLKDIYFYTSTIGGGLGFKNYNNSTYTLITDGPQLFTGLNTSPTFKLGTFLLTQFNGPGQYTLTISNLDAVPGVPEPSTWAMMLLGFGAVGYRMRRRRLLGTRVTV